MTLMSSEFRKALCELTLDCLHSRKMWHYAPGGTAHWPVEVIDARIAALGQLKRVGVPQDIGRVVVFLVSAESEWINGLTALQDISRLMLTR